MYKLYLFEDFDSITKQFLEQCISVLPQARKQKALSYRFDIDRKMSVISYLLLLYALRENYGIANPHISYGAFGKPFLTEYPGIHFNISHCPKGCICAVSDKEIGVDIQDIRPFSWDIARCVCYENELKLLERTDDKALLFTKIWAMKESYVKMTGEGITNINLIDTTKIKDEIITFDRKRIIISIVKNKKKYL